MFASELEFYLWQKILLAIFFEVFICSFSGKCLPNIKALITTICQSDFQTEKGFSEKGASFIHNFNDHKELFIKITTVLCYATEMLYTYTFLFVVQY